MMSVALIQARHFERRTWSVAIRHAVPLGLFSALVYAASPAMWATVESVTGRQGVGVVAAVLVICLAASVIVNRRRRRTATGQE